MSRFSYHKSIPLFVTAAGGRLEATGTIRAAEKPCNLLGGDKTVGGHEGLLGVTLLKYVRHPIRLSPSPDGPSCPSSR